MFSLPTKIIGAVAVVACLALALMAWGTKRYNEGRQSVIDQQNAALVAAMRRSIEAQREARAQIELAAERIRANEALTNAKIDEIKKRSPAFKAWADTRVPGDAVAILRGLRGRSDGHRLRD